MKKSKRLLALLLSVMLTIGAVCSVPFTASAAEVELEETGAYSLKFDSLNLLGGEVIVDRDYYSVSDPEAVERTPVYARFDTDEAGYYVLYVKNNNMTAGEKALTIGIVDKNETLDSSMGLKNGEESELAVRLEADTRYYIKLSYTFEEICYGGNIDIKLSYFADAEPDEMKPDITVNAGKAYEGSIDVAEDKDWIFVATANNKKHSITLENLNEEKTAFKAEVYDSKNNLLATLTTEEKDSVTVELEKPSAATSYYICVTGINTNVRGSYSVQMDEVLPVSVNVPLNEEYYDTIAGFGKEGSRDYLKFTTIDKDAYYTIYVKNIDISTHSWATDNAVQIEVLNANSEEIDRIRLLPEADGAVTLKLKPDTTYFMQVYNNYLPDTQGGNYKVQITYVLDPDKNEMENATEWELEKTYYGNLAARGDSDFFKITTNEETDYTFTVKNINIPTHSWSSDLRFRGVIYNDKNESLATVMRYSGEEGSARVTLDANTTYYICIWDPEGTTGEYSFDLSVTVIIDEEAVGMANATEIPYNEDYYDSITNWEGDNKVDFLKFTTLNEPAYYTLTAKNINIPTHSWSGDHQVQVKVWNEHKEELGKLTLAEGAESSATFRFDENTTYYIRINNNENNGGNYKVHLSYVLDPESNEMEKGNTLRIGERYYGNLAARGDDDFFKITTNEGTDYTLYLKNINISTHSWSSDYQFRAAIYNKYSEELGKILLTAGKEDTFSLALEPDTTYYIKVCDPEGTTGEYNVMLAESVLLGDVNLDAKVNIKDATTIQKSLAKLVTLEGQQINIADVTEDGKVNIKDATAIQKFLAKIETDYKTGQLILNEIKYSEPATEATEPETETLPAETTLVADPTEATDATEATETPEVTAATEATEVTDSTAIAGESTPLETTPVSQLDTLRALNEEAHLLLEEYADYEYEKPLAGNSDEMAVKVQLGYADEAEASSKSEYEKLFSINDRITYYLMHGYQYTDDHSEYINELTNEMAWFKYYVTELRTTPVIRNFTVYLKNTLNWKEVYIYCYSSQSGDKVAIWPGVKMSMNSDGVYYYEVPEGYDRVIFCSTEDAYYYSAEADLSQYEDKVMFSLDEDFNNGYKLIKEDFPIITY